MICLEGILPLQMRTLGGMPLLMSSTKVGADKVTMTVRVVTSIYLFRGVCTIVSQGRALGQGRGDVNSKSHLTREGSTHTIELVSI